MLPFTQKIKELRSFNSGAHALSIEKSKIFANEIIDMNVSQQYAGQTSKGTPIRPPYTQATVNYKQFVGQPTDRVTLRDTEDFHRSFTIEFKRLQFEITALDYKTSALKAKYGDRIFGLTNANLDSLKVMILPEMINEFRKRVT